MTNNTTTTARSTIFYRVPSFLHTICGQHSSRAISLACETEVHLTQCATCHFAESTPGGSLPSPACVRWWGEVNWAVGTAVNVYSVKANTAKVIIMQNPHSITFSPQYTVCDFSPTLMLLQAVEHCSKLFITCSDTEENHVMSLWSYCKHDVLYRF